MRDRLLACSARIGFALLVFAVLATAILLRPAKWLSDFDQAFYLTIAYDLVHHGVFSNGVFDDVNSTAAVPPPGRFFGPVYPWLAVAAMKIDPRFARAVDCVVEATHKARDGAECEVYARPMHLFHAALLALGMIAIALAAELIFASAMVFWLAGILATVALLPDADLFAFVMTESVTFALYSVAALALVLALQAPRVSRNALTGCLFGLLCLTRPSFLVLAPVVAGLIAVNDRWLARSGWRSAAKHVLAFAVAWLLVVGPWLVRNAVSVGKWGLTEEYGSVTLIERFAFNNMSTREFVLAFPYCLPEIGEPVIDWAFGPEAMERFVYYSPKSFFHVGRAHRDRQPRPAPGGHHPVSPGQRVPGLVRNVGRRVPGPRVRTAVRVGLRLGRAPIETAVPALRGAALGDAGTARGGRQSVHPLQSHPDRVVLGRRRLDDRANDGIARGAPPISVQPIA